MEDAYIHIHALYSLFQHNTILLKDQSDYLK